LKIAVALSGGVDSTTVARRLQQAGHEVIGLTMRLCPDLSDLPRIRHAIAKMQPGLKQHGCKQCVAPCACLDGTEVARLLGIRHEILDLSSEFEKLVIEPFIHDFINGYTPNPCAVCNRSVKFGILLDYARVLGTEFMATGHYACLEKNNGTIAVGRSKDPNKDQTYFISLVPQERFQHVLFPLCDNTRTEIEQEAEFQGLVLKRSATSTEICFLRELNYADFLRQRVPDAFVPGNIVDLSGRKLGEHKGLPNYTIGQRRGLGVAAPYPLYVVRLCQTSNQVVVGPDEALWTSRVRVRELNWLTNFSQTEMTVQAMIRYRQSPVSAKIQFCGDKEAILTFTKPVRAVTPGQIAAVYDNNRLLGGGRIVGAEA